MTNKALGIMAMITSPFLFLDFYINGGSIGDETPYRHTSLSGFFGLLFISGWMCSTVAMLRHANLIRSRILITILYIQIILLTGANLWNIYEIIQPGAPTTLFDILNLMWPASYTFMFVTGVAWIAWGRTSDVLRWAPLGGGLWSLFSMCCVIIIQNDRTCLLLSGAYAFIVWTLVGMMVMNLTNNRTNSR